MAEQRGTTTLGDGSRAPKSDPRVAALAHCQDATAALGVVLGTDGDLPGPVLQLLAALQNDLLDVVADLGTPVSGEGKELGESGDGTVRLDEDYVARLRPLVEHYTGELPETPTRVVPGGTAAGALLHKARTAVLVAEQAAWAARDAHGDAVNPLTAEYLDVLGDLLLALARSANAEHGDTVWQPRLSAAAAG